MAHNGDVKITGPIKYQTPRTVNILLLAMIVVGGLTLALGLIKDPVRIWPSYLTSLFFFVSLALGGVFFAAIQHMSNAAWSVSTRRFSESFSAFLPISVILVLAFVIFGAPHIYDWLNPEIVAKDYLIQKKTAYLNQTFFIIRTVAFFALWLFFSYKIVSKSLKQDQTGEVSLTRQLVPWSIGFILVFAISYSLFSVDVLMSLDPYWYSTMFGVYCFSGLFQATLAMLLLFIICFRKKGILDGIVTDEHVHDVAKFMFAFTIFYAYIAFSQFMLIWYANLPEETEFFIHRAHGAWYYISLSLLFLRFLVPFLVLLPRSSKRSPMVAGSMAVLILIMQYVDLYWLVYPNFNDGHVVFSFWEIGMFLGFLGLFLFSVHRFLTKNSIVPVKDPRLQESLHHHV